MASRRFALFVVVALAVMAPVTPSGGTGAAGTAGSQHERRQLTPPHHGRSTLETATGLTMTITAISPEGLTPTRPVRLSGTVTNVGTQPWTDAQVYLSIGGAPALSKTVLDTFAADDEGFGTTINDLGLFDEIGRLRPGTGTDWHVAVPFDRLPISRAAGVYQIGATLLATNAEGRDSIADARVSTTIPYLPDSAAAPRPTSVVTLLPVTAPVLRHPDGVFVNEELARLLSSGGRLRNLLDFAAQAPPGSLELVVDPALRQAVTAMAAGYHVRSFRQAARGIAARSGSGRQEAAAWLNDLATLRQRQQMTLLPWGDPATSSLADAGMPGVVDAAVVASQRYAAANSLSQTVADWQTNGFTTRRGLAVSRLAGAAIHVISEQSLPGLIAVDSAAYPPAELSVNTHPGPLTVVVTRSDIGGRPFVPALTALQFRQALMAEATVRALSGDNHPTSVFAAPFNWDPGNLSLRADIAAGYSYPTVAAQSLQGLAQRVPPTYTGGLPLPSSRPPLPTATLEAIKRLRDSGTVYTDLLTDHRQVAITFEEQFAIAGSSAWRWKPVRGTAAIRELAKGMSGQIAEVTVTGPAFVAMSSNTGRFPLTVSNGLDMAVTVKISVHPLNRALKIAPIPPLQLGAGQSRDIDVESSASGSGVTQVRARLTTISDRSFGRPFDFNIRATQIGLAIWIAMAIGLAALLVSAARRIYMRARGRGFKTRGESAA